MDGAVVRPFWGTATSYLNFCEEDYVVTRYIAEFINTLSSLVFVIYGVYGLCHIRWDQHASSRLISHLGLIGVGVCSAGYHMTLKYHTQMSDELSMHLLTTPLIHRILTYKCKARKKRQVGIILSILFTVVMTTHIVMDEFLLHATAFAAAVYIIATRALKIITEKDCHPHLKSKLRNVAVFGCVNFGFGYFVWLIDSWACSFLSGVRHTVGFPLAFFLELHGWWHIFTAIGGYIAVAVIDAITSDEGLEDPISCLAWPVPLASELVSIMRQESKEN